MVSLITQKSVPEFEARRPSLRSLKPHKPKGANQHLSNPFPTSPNAFCQVPPSPPPVAPPARSVESEWRRERFDVTSDYVKAAKESSRLLIGGTTNFGGPRRHIGRVLFTPKHSKEAKGGRRRRQLGKRSDRVSSRLTIIDVDMHNSMEVADAIFKCTAGISAGKKRQKRA
ncbi:hypothetical protein L596_023201 [Steinernema carpocapsae]|uniref:Uncharacterized protein n=1 Tax=Steinernema carpocapsae TaxID=34508 RepID=A0A4U5MDR0_STECR|nr:hypothetical protein L596_023201 [Steinernema carpocapsae]